jgi:nicotinamidase-related amidase/type 1 glutamine amidotransferase
LVLGLAVAASADTLELHARGRRAISTNGSGWALVEEVRRWDGRQTALIVCDMWDRHWCQGASARVAEMAPRMNEVLKAARLRGVLVVHAPSETMRAYADRPERQRALAAPKTAAPADVAKWKTLNRGQEGPLPIDDADGGCDDTPACAQGNPWRGQVAALEIQAQDVISDSGEEIHNVLQQRGIQNALIMGVHANMCVLGRPFAIRALVGLGKDVLLLRDLTDTMYNSWRRPFVNHFAGTDLVVGHIEKHWCPSITSADFLGGEPFRFQADQRRTIVMVLGESEYHTAETLPAFAEEELYKRGLRLEYVTATTRDDDYQFQNIRALQNADLVLVSARRRAMPVAMRESLQRHWEAGRPIVGLRTASHAFALRGEARTPLAAKGLADWPEFDAQVLGGHYTGHYPAGPKTTVRAATGAVAHPILRGIDDAGWTSSASLYKSGPLAPTAQPLLVGTLPGQPGEPVAWVNRAGPRPARVFHTSLGHPDDFRQPQFRQLLAQGILWAVEAPEENRR